MDSRRVMGPITLVWAVKRGFLNDTATCDCAPRLYISCGLIVSTKLLREDGSNKSD